MAIEELVRKLGVDVPKTMAREMILTWDEVEEMAKNGVAFGSHTVHHPTLIGLPLEQARQEIIDSKRRIEEKLDQPANSFSYPDGREANISDGIRAILSDNGFVCAVYAEPNRLVSPGADPYGLARVSPKWDFTTFRLSVSGVYPDWASITSRLGRG
jgi:peptidoglycan/xylan/chitin deacetylase (PgdA/CDA1 family)